MLQQPLQIDRLRNAVTIGAAFLMGFIDTYTLTQFSNVFASAQIGNMVTFGIMLASGQAANAFLNALSLSGYFLGTLYGDRLLSRLKLTGHHRLRVFLAIQAFILLYLACFQHILRIPVKIFILAVLSGHALTTYQSFAATPVNVGLMTGNLQKVMNNLYRVLFRRDTDARDDLLHVLGVLVFFMMGAGISMLVIQWNPSAILWISFSLAAVFLLRLYRPDYG
ncbi:DUF1275 family protein [Sporosarcina sp. NCCP-2716]|uniref:YoaK family protein n=1 Tax=Sporosarcina sp. NCCP-2716 TaxID=2943679 RepID=UPI00203D2229|nr:YoaK family protein [Sporosarcina sp. NCCP-2716]GKV70323.1 DUF1275 family protein [Sporosarcina sp. NCCP-2716]